MSGFIGCPLALVSSLVLAAPLLPKPSEVSAQLDAAVEAKWPDRGIDPEGTADDATFLRRVWLDLGGRVPSALVAREFLDDSRADKRARHIDRLLAGEDFADYWARAWTIRL